MKKQLEPLKMPKKGKRAANEKADGNNSKEVAQILSDIKKDPVDPHLFYAIGRARSGNGNNVFQVSTAPTAASQFMHVHNNALKDLLLKKLGKGVQMSEDMCPFVLFKLAYPGSPQLEILASLAQDDIEQFMALGLKKPHGFGNEEDLFEEEEVPIADL